MPRVKQITPATVVRDLIAGLVVVLVAVPLCLGIGQASGAQIPPLAGILAGIVGGVVVGLLSGSQTSVSGPTAGLTAIVATQVAGLGSFEAFLLALVIAGLLQIAMGAARLGFLSSYFPSSVIYGLIAAVGVILILKQVPHLLGHDVDPEGEMSFFQPDKENTFSELLRTIRDIHPGAALVGILSFALLLIWDNVKPLKKLIVPPALLVILLGVALSEVLGAIGGVWAIEARHRVQLPAPESLQEWRTLLHFADFSYLTNPSVYLAGLTIALIASLESLLNIEAIDRLDPRQRVTPTSRELVAQGVGNLICGVVGGLPVTSVIDKSSVNIHAGAQTQYAAVAHGVMLGACAFLLPVYVNHIPISCLAAVLLWAGAKLASPQLFIRMYQNGTSQFLRFLITLAAIVFTNLLTGALIGLAIGLVSILRSNLLRPLRVIEEKRQEGVVTRVELANQVSFLNRGVIDKTLASAKRGSNWVIDARQTDYIDPDVLSLIREFREQAAPAREIKLSLIGFTGKFPPLEDQVHLKEYTTKEIQAQYTPADVLQLLKEGNERFRTGATLPRNLRRQLDAAAQGQHPLAVILSCIDSRSPAELIFDLGLGDIFSVRVAGNITSPKVLGSMEYACAVAGAKLVLVLGHTKCGAVTAATSFACTKQDVTEATGCSNLEPIMRDIQRWIDKDICDKFTQLSGEQRAALADTVARLNVVAVVEQIRRESPTLARLEEEGKIAIVGAMYDVGSGRFECLSGTLVDPTESLMQAVSDPALTE